MPRTVCVGGRFLIGTFDAISFWDFHTTWQQLLLFVFFFFFTSMAENSLTDKLCNAAASGNLPDVLFWLQNGADVNGLNKYKRTALQVGTVQTLFTFICVCFHEFCSSLEWRQAACLTSWYHLCYYKPNHILASKIRLGLVQQCVKLSSPKSIFKWRNLRGYKEEVRPWGISARPSPIRLIKLFLNQSFFSVCNHCRFDHVN